MVHQTNPLDVKKLFKYGFFRKLGIRNDFRLGTLLRNGRKPQNLNRGLALRLSRIGKTRIRIRIRLDIRIRKLGLENWLARS